MKNDLHDLLDEFLDFEHRVCCPDDWYESWLKRVRQAMGESPSRAANTEKWKHASLRDRVRIARAERTLANPAATLEDYGDAIRGLQSTDVPGTEELHQKLWAGHRRLEKKKT